MFRHLRPFSSYFNRKCPGRLPAAACISATWGGAVIIKGAQRKSVLYPRGFPSDLQFGLSDGFINVFVALKLLVGKAAGVENILRDDGVSRRGNLLLGKAVQIVGQAQGIGIAVF
ncbi:hypothetical protein ELI_2102 [Eubacterium callanderi]|uniref:Uncharacterized protein n=1 Tax=Eubacterium callanderi TaxID=53442 RepID=E3GMM2_9FIRM|nr:hypothetical protein ELI_2102 [Eubacterium callanderi]